MEVLKTRVSATGSKHGETGEHPYPYAYESVGLEVTLGSRATREVCSLSTSQFHQPQRSVHESCLLLTKYRKSLPCGYFGKAFLFEKPNMGRKNFGTNASLNFSKLLSHETDNNANVALNNVFR